MSKIKFWTSILDKDPRKAAQSAAILENDGWDGAAIYDSQCLFPEAWINLALCAQATKTIGLRTGVTNPITRHPSVTAAAAASIQLISDGRFVLGLGRGDSALAYVGAAPMVMGKFEPYMEMLQTYLRGEMVSLEDAGSVISDAATNFDKVAINSPPPGSSLTWLKEVDPMPKVPLEAMVSGPKAIEAAARVADIVTFGLVAEPNRIRWGIETARNAAAAVGRDPNSLQLGAYVPVVAHADVNIAREMARPGLASMARFSVMNKAVVGPTTGNQQATLEKIASVYDMNKHAGGVGPQAAALDTEFIDQFAIAGPPEYCIARLRELADLGIGSFTVSTARGAGPEHDASYRLLVDEVLPALRG